MKLRVPGNTEFERFDNAMKKILSVSKDEMNRRIEADPRGHPKKKKRKPAKASACVRHVGHFSLRRISGDLEKGWAVRMTPVPLSREVREEEQQRVGPDCVGCGKYYGIYGPVGGALCVVCYEKTDAYRAWEP